MMKEKMLDALSKSINAEIIVPIVHVHFNACLIKKVYFGCRVFSLSETEVNVLKSICKVMLMRKLRLSEKFLRIIMHVRKTPLGIELIASRVIIDVITLKSFFPESSGKSDPLNLVFALCMSIKAINYETISYTSPQVLNSNHKMQQPSYLLKEPPPTQRTNLSMIHQNTNSLHTTKRSKG